MAHSHRSSSLKQSNKGHKQGKASKRSINRAQGGKVQNRTSIKKKGGESASCKVKANRDHMAKQRREASKDKLLQKRRAQGRLNVRNADSSIVPRVIGIVSLSDDEFELEKYVKDFLIDGADKKIGAVDGSASVTAMYAKHKKEGHITFLTNTTAFRNLYKDSSVNQEDASVQAVLDLTRVCDSIVFLLDGRDADKTKSAPITGMNIGDGASTTTSSTNVQQDYDHLVSARGDRILKAIKAQGLPTPLTLLVNFEGEGDDDTMSMASFQSLKSVRRSALKGKLELKKYLTRFASMEFGEGACKVMEIDLPSVDEGEEMNEDNKNTASVTVGKSKKILPDALLNNGADVYPTRDAFVRTLCSMNATPPKWVAEMPRAYILSDNNAENGGHVYDKVSNELKITGFVRGKVPFDVNSLVHIPNVGTFGVKQIVQSESPTLQRRKGLPGDSGADDDSSKILAVCDMTKREPLNMFANPDALDGEQNLIGFEDDDDDDGNEYNDDDVEAKKEDDKFARPAGWNDYQSAWLDGLKDDEGMLEDDEEEGIDHGELAAELNSKKKSGASEITSMDMDAEDANYISAEERKALVAQRKTDQKVELEFPDEVQIDENENAIERFARYRSLKSFRQSFWDPKENLPSSYASIFHFGSFKATQGDIMADMKDVMKATNSQFQDQVEKSKATKDGDDVMEDASDDSDDDDDEDEDLLEGCIASGTYVTLILEGVSPTAYARISSSSLLTAVALLAHENKMSVLHMSLSETTQCDEPSAGDMPVKSKDVLTFRCGWRTWQARPVFSQNNLNSDKHKFERFMPTGGTFFAASVLGPVTYTPCPVLVFRKGNAGNTQFVVLGSMMGADADRIVVKRIVLTGYPTRVQWRHAVVKYMFYNPDDVKVR